MIASEGQNIEVCVAEDPLWRYLSLLAYGANADVWETVAWLSARILIWQDNVACCMRLPCSESPTGKQLFEANNADVTQQGGDVLSVFWGWPCPVHASMKA